MIAIKNSLNVSIYCQTYGETIASLSARWYSPSVSQRVSFNWKQELGDLSRMQSIMKFMNSHNEENS